MHAYYEMHSFYRVCLTLACSICGFKKTLSIVFIVFLVIVLVSFVMKNNYYYIVIVILIFLGIVIVIVTNISLVDS